MEFEKRFEWLVTVEFGSGLHFDQFKVNSTFATVVAESYPSFVMQFSDLAVVKRIDTLA